MAGGQLFNAANECARTGYVVDGEVGVERLEIHLAGYSGMLQDGLQLRTEIEVAGALAVVERLDAHAVAGQHEAAAGFRPKRHAEHAAQAGKAIGIPLEESVEEGFGVAAGVEAMTQSFQIGADFEVVVNLPVECNHGVAVIGNDRLVAAREIDDFQTDGAESGVAAVKDAALIRPAMTERIDDTLGNARLGRPIRGCESGDPTHSTPLIPGSGGSPLRVGERA